MSIDKALYKSMDTLLTYFLGIAWVERQEGNMLHTDPVKTLKGHTKNHCLLNVQSTATLPYA